MVYDLTDVFVLGSVVVLSAFYLIFLLKYFMSDQQFFKEVFFMAIESLKSFLYFVSDWALPAYFTIAFFGTIYVIYKVTKEING